MPRTENKSYGGIGGHILGQVLAGIFTFKLYTSDICLLRYMMDSHAEHRRRCPRHEGIHRRV